MAKRILPLIPPGLAVERVAPSPDRITILAKPQTTTASCPGCGQASTRVHARYQRRLQDLPWQGRPATLLVRVRRFLCPSPACPRRTFTEHLGPAAARSARRTERLGEVQRQLGLALGGEAGARIATRLAMPISPDTLLRLVHRAVVPQPPTPRVLGVDDWAWRRGQSYGTILVDLERNTVIDLLPDRETATLATWLKGHEGIEVVARDRAGAYADAVRQGAPDAVQAADRWHLLRNLGEALQGVVDRHRGAVRQAARALAGEITAPAGPVPPATREEQQRTARRDRRRLRYEEMVRLHRLGLPGHAISRAVGASPLTVHRWLKAGGPPTAQQAGTTPQCRPARGLPRPPLGRGLPQWRAALARTPGSGLSGRPAERRPLDHAAAPSGTWRCCGRSAPCCGLAAALVSARRSPAGHAARSARGARAGLPRPSCPGSPRFDPRR